MPKKDDSDDYIDIDPEKIKDSKKDKEDFEKESKDFPVLGSDDDQFIVETSSPGLFSRISSGSIFKKGNPFKRLNLGKKVKDKVKETFREEKPKESIPKKKESSDNEKFFMSGDSEEPDENEFIIDGFEGIYDRERTYDLKRFYRIAFISLIVLLLVSGIFAVGFVVARNIVTTDQECPFQCCDEEDEYEERLCPGLSECVENECVKPECPSDYECCPGELYQQEECDSDYEECNEDYECVQKECPYACCTDSDGFQNKECANEGNCINNECVLDSCPYSCCKDELEYEDRECDSGNVCRENECVPIYVDVIQRAFNFIYTAVRILIR